MTLRRCVFVTRKIWYQSRLALKARNDSPLELEIHSISIDIHILPSRRHYRRYLKPYPLIADLINVQASKEYVRLKALQLSPSPVVNPSHEG